MKLLLPIIYALVFFVILYLLGFIKSKYLATKVQRNNFMVSFHAFVVPSATLLYFLLNPEFFTYEPITNAVLVNLYSASVGFYIFSTISLYLSEKNPEKAMIAHHFIVGGFLLFATYIPNLPGYFAFILVPQCTAFVYHIYLILKDTIGENIERIERWFNYNYYVWLIMRFVIQGVFTFFAFYYEFTQFKLTLSIRVFLVIGICFSYFFNVYWLVLIVKKRKYNKAQRALNT